MDHKYQRSGMDLTIVDTDGDTLDAEPSDSPAGGDLVYVRTSGCGVYLSAETARALRDYLDDYLGDKPAPLVQQLSIGSITVDLEPVQGDGRGNAWNAAGVQVEFADESQPEPLAEWERELLDGPPPTVLDEAQALVYGDRGQDYGHPREGFTRTAILWTGLLHHLLADGAHITPEDVVRCMVGIKLARDVNAPKRDNRVDIAGYALCLDRLETGQ